jgi:hypothetical protein
LQDRFGTVQGQCSHNPFQLTQQGLFSTSTVSLFNSHTSYCVFLLNCTVYVQIIILLLYVAIYYLYLYENVRL